MKKTKYSQSFESADKCHSTYKISVATGMVNFKHWQLGPLE